MNKKLSVVGLILGLALVAAACNKSVGTSSDNSANSMQNNSMPQDQGTSGDNMKTNDTMKPTNSMPLNPETTPGNSMDNSGSMNNSVMPNNK